MQEQEKAFEQWSFGSRPLRFFSSKQGLLIAFISGVLYSLSFEPFGLSFLAWFAVGFFYISGFRRADKGLFLYGFVFSLTHLIFSNWFLNPVGWWIPFVVSFGYCFLIPLWFYFSRKLYWCLAFPKAEDTCGDAQPKQFLLSSKNEIVWIFATSFLWCFFEWVRFWLYTGYPWDLLGVSQYEGLARYVASNAGILSVSFVVILVNMSVAVFLERFLVGFKTQEKLPWQVMPKLFAIGISLLIILFSYINFTPSKGRDFVKAILLQGNFSAYKAVPANERFGVFKNLVFESLKHKPELYIWSETCLPWYEDTSRYLEYVINKSRASHIIGILRSKYDGKLQRYNSALFYSYPFDNKPKIYDKIHLVPYGEYVPLRSLMTPSFRKKVEKLTGMGTSLQRGKTRKIFSLRDNQLRLGIQICFEDFFGYISRQLVSSNANALLVMSNDAWYEKTAGGLKHRTQAVFRALETNLPLIRVGNHCESALIAPSGRIVTSYEKQNGQVFGRGYAVIQIPIIKDYKPTFFVLYPNFFKILICLISLVFFWFLLYRFGVYKLEALRRITKEEKNL